MTRKQRYRYEMLVRVNDFGTAHRALFPESSKGGRRFVQVAAAVAAVEDRLKKRDIARVEARRVKAATRAAVTAYMKTIRRTARRVTAPEKGMNTFFTPRSGSVTALVSAAKAYIDEARPREAEFVEFGLRPTFLSDFTALVDRLDSAVVVRNTGRSRRLSAQDGIEDALRSGAEALVDLDVLVPNAVTDDAVAHGYWRGARRIEGLGSSSSSSKAVKLSASPPAAAPPDATTDEPPVVEVATQQAGETPPDVETVTPVPFFDERFERAS